MRKRIFFKKNSKICRHQIYWWKIKYESEFQKVVASHYLNETRHRLKYMCNMHNEWMNTNYHNR